MNMRPHGKELIILTVLLSLQFLLFPLTALKAEENFHQGRPGFSLSDRAQLALANKEYEKAIPDFVQLVQEEGADSYIVRGFVKAFYGADRLDEADEVLSHLAKKYPQSSEIKFGQGLSAFYQGKQEKAESFFDSSLKLDSKNALAWNAWSAVLSERGLYELAVEKNWKAIRNDPEESIFFVNLRHIYKQMEHPELFVGKYKEQVEKGEMGIALGFAKVLARELRQEGFKHYSQQNLDLTIKAFLKIEKIYKEVRYISGIVPALFSLGLLYDEKGDTATSQLYYQQVLDLNPEHLQARDKIKKVFPEE